MKIAAILTLAAATLTQAQYARVVNDCTFTAYVQSVPYDGSPSGPLTTVPANGGVFAEAYRPSGSTVKMGTLPQLRAPLFFGYSRSDNPYQVYYDLNNRFGNPFAAQRVSQFASRAGCPFSDCAPNNSSCYDDASNSKVMACGRPTNVTTTLCAPS